MKKLEVGCGRDKRAGYIGMDIVKLPLVDIVHDMNIAPWPFEDDSFDEIVFDDVLEHSKEFLVILTEIYRVAKNNAIIKISVPHFSCDNMYTDPTHTIFFSSRSFNYFDKSLNNRYGYYLRDVDFRICKVYLSFREYFTKEGEKKTSNIFRFIGLEYLINKYPRIYERFFAWILPVAEIYFELEVKK
ncbi:MAG: class I SAM-dependent methyltransferase [Clostridiales bacterium]